MPLNPVRAVPALTCGAVNSGSTSVGIPAGTLPGSYFILARADATDAVPESNEGNNVTGKPVAIAP